MAAVDLVRVVTVGVGLVGLLAATWSAIRLRGEYPFSPRSVAFGGAGLAASAALAALLPPIAFHEMALWALLAGGILVGLAAGLAVRMRRVPDGVVARGGGWHTLPAAVAFGGLQVSSVADSPEGAIVSTAGLLAAASLAGAAGSLLLLRWFRLRLRGPRAAAVPAAAAPSGGPMSRGVPGGASPAGMSTAPSVVRSTPGRPGPGRPGTAPAAGSGAAPAARVADVRAACAACGSPVAPGWRHCVGCGALLAWETRAG